MNARDQYYAKIDNELNALEGRDGVMLPETLGRVIIAAVIVAAILFVGLVVF